MDTNDILLYNGKIYLEKGRFAQAIRVSGGRIAAVGENDPLLAAAEGAEKIDLAGKTVIPGLIDQHVHVTGGGKVIVSAAVFCLIRAVQPGCFFTVVRGERG